MYFRELILSVAIISGFAAPSNAQERWSGFYGGLSVNGYQTNSDVSESPVNNHEAEGAGLGFHVGYNFAGANGFVWGPELTASFLNVDGLQNGPAPVGTTEFNGSYLVSPRVRLGYATNKVFYYGILGLGVSDLGARSINASSKNTHAASVIGLGSEIAWDDLWSTKFELTYTSWKNDEQSFGPINRNVETDITMFTIGVTRKF